MLRGNQKQSSSLLHSTSPKDLGNGTRCKQQPSRAQSLRLTDDEDKRTCTQGAAHACIKCS